MVTKSVGWVTLTPTGNQVTDTNNFVTARDTGKPIFITNDGQTPLATQATTIFADRDCIIEGNGVLWTQMTDHVPIQIIISAETSYSVSAIASVQRNYSGASNTTLVSRLTMSTLSQAANIVVGDLYKVTSEDKAPGGAVSQNPRMGEVMRVVEVDVPNGHVYLNSELYAASLYVTTMQITRFRGQDHRTSIKNIRFRADSAGIAGVWLNPQMWIESTHLMELTGIDILRSFSSGAFLMNNYGAKVEANIRQVVYDLDLGQTGYGILISAENHGSYNIRGRDCRHVITDGWTSGSTGSVYRHGPVLHCEFRGHADGCWGAGFDFHDSAARCTMLGLISSNCIDGPQGLGAGIQVRGFGNRLIGCSTFGNEWGIQAFANNDDGSDDLMISGYYSDDKQGSLVFAGRPLSATKMKVWVQGGMMRWSSAGFGVVANDCDVTFQDTLFAPRYQSGGALLFLAGETIIRGQAVWDGEAAAGTWALTSTSGVNNNAILRMRSDAPVALPGDAAYTVTDLTPEIVSFATTLTADRAVTITCTARRRVIIKRQAAGAFNLNITHSGGVLALAATNRYAIFEIDGAQVMLVATGAL